MTFTNALFVTFSHDHTPQALRALVELVRRDGGRVSVLGVIPPTPKLQRLLTPRDTTDHIEQVLHDALTDDVRAWVKTAAGSATPDDVSIDVVTGHPVATVLRRLLDEDHDLLAVTSHPDDAEARAVVKRLQRKSPCPVWAIRPTRARKRRVLAAVDTDAEHHGLDHRILAAARWLTRPGDELHVVTAWEVIGESTLRSSPFVGADPGAVDELCARYEADHAAALQQLVEEQDDGPVTPRLHIHHGRAADVILAMVERYDINQLVMGTMGRAGIPGFIVGNTAEQLLSEVPCAEFVVKPPGFTSPFHP